MDSMHTVNGLQKVADAAMDIPATFDEIARGKIIWDDEDADA